ncbi:gamma-glutamyl AIG2-like cyclotransferase [Nocardiopsis sp. Huas11]|uniref:gamma-glutamylcyclotransferase family protein n=1 Tax=Nocardiopsis sp. Huas11 TaxID=2183912 RepID=UPI000EABA7B0|nr:gamma-glutamylcyclotransferase family protein [Nocardiopsis sp. Huas11]RKS09977.1 gamma-glutamyl AIG2-like cyclotransferase [Nocardiopsis sp. Huas11]
MSEGILANPFWQGVGALAGLAAVILYLIVELRRRRHTKSEPGADIDAQSWHTFDLSTTEGEDAFYKELVKSITNAEDCIYRSGRGFSRSRHERYINDLIRAEETALRNGVDITRIQLSSWVDEVWANACADLIEQYPENLRMFADYGEAPLVNVAVIDAYGPSPVIQILFEAHEVAPGRPRQRGSAAVFLHGNSALASSLQGQFEEYTQSLDRMTSESVRSLSQAPIYFAYGSNISTRQMQSRCPSARRVGTGYLYGWSRSFCVPAPHMSGLAAGIQRSDYDDSYVTGVVYEMTPSDQRRLDDIERGGYRPQRVGVKVDGTHRDAYTHVPVITEAENLSEVPLPYLETMLAGAEENGLEGFARNLRKIIEDAT